MEEIEHPLLDPPKIFDALTFLLQFVPLRRDQANESRLREDIRTTIQDYLDKNDLSERVRLWAKDRDKHRLAPVSLFGAQFLPDMALEEEGRMVAAILVKLVRGSRSALAQAAGLALICSYQYPWVLTLILDKGRRLREDRTLDHEFRAHMWHHRRIRFLFR